MNDIITIALKAFPVIALITTGVVLEKTAFISAEAVKGMKKLIMNLALPCLLFLILLDADLQADYLWGSVAVFITCLLAFSLGFLFKKIWKSSNAFFLAVYSSFVTGVIGYPLFISTFGAEHLYRLAILDIGNLIFIFIVLATFLDKVGCNQTGRKRMSLKDQVKHIVKSPFLISMFLGILVSMLGGRTFFHTNPATAASLTAAGMLAEITLPLILLVIGYELHFDLKQLLVPLPAVLLRIGMMLLLAYLLNTFVIDRLLGLDRLFQMAVYTMFICPPSFIIPVFIEGDCPDKSFIMNFLSLNVILSILTFIMLMTVLL